VRDPEGSHKYISMFPHIRERSRVWERRHERERERENEREKKESPLNRDGVGMYREKERNDREIITHIHNECL